VRHYDEFRSSLKVRFVGVAAVSRVARSVRIEMGADARGNPPADGSADITDFLGQRKIAISPRRTVRKTAVGIPPFVINTPDFRLIREFERHPVSLIEIKSTALH